MLVMTMRWNPGSIWIQQRHSHAEVPARCRLRRRSLVRSRLAGFARKPRAL